MGQITKFVTSALIRWLVSPVSVDLSVHPDKELPEIKNTWTRLPSFSFPAVERNSHSASLKWSEFSWWLYQWLYKWQGSGGVWKRGQRWLCCWYHSPSFMSQLEVWVCPLAFPMGNVWYVLTISACHGLQKAPFGRQQSLPCLGLDKSWVKGLSQQFWPGLLE